MGKLREMYQNKELKADPHRNSIFRLLLPGKHRPHLTRETARAGRQDWGVVTVQRARVWVRAVMTAGQKGLGETYGAKNQ